MNQAIALYKCGEKRQAAALFAEFAALEPLNETAWLWMAACAETPAEKRAYLQRVLAINPDHEKAKLALARLMPAEEPSLDDLADSGQEVAPQEVAGARQEVAAQEVAAPQEVAARQEVAAARQDVAGQELRSQRELESILGLARMAEQNREYQQAYGFYCTALELDEGCQEAWIGKGIAAGMSSTYHKTYTAEVKHCLWEKVLVRGRSGITRENFLEGISPRTLKHMIDGFAMAGSRLVEILENIDFTSEKNVMRVLELDRESLSLYDTAYFLTRFQGEDYYKRPDWHDMVKITRQAIRRIEYGMSVLSLPQAQVDTYKGLALKALLLSRLAGSTSFIKEIQAGGG